MRPHFTRPSLAEAEQLLARAHKLRQAGRSGPARPALEDALDMLRRLRPTLARDTLLAWTHLELAALHGERGQRGKAEQHLRWGISYARTCGNAEARSQAQRQWNDWQPST